MKRIFRCPIEAAYMAKHYGVRFFYENGSHKPERELPLWAIARCIEHPKFDAVFVASQDDEHIFAPKDGDIDDDGLFIFDRKTEPAIRNGRAFFCGEIEG